MQRVSFRRRRKFTRIDSADFFVHACQKLFDEVFTLSIFNFWLILSLALLIQFQCFSHPGSRYPRCRSVRQDYFPTKKTICYYFSISLYFYYCSLFNRILSVYSALLVAWNPYKCCKRTHKNNRNKHGYREHKHHRIKHRIVNTK